MTYTNHPHGKKPPQAKPENKPLKVACKACGAPVSLAEGVCISCGELVKMPKVKRRPGGS